jgi:predicted GIY-YIG superfamily endonuclease
LNSTIDDKIYFGITNNPNRRLFEHINYTPEKRHHNGNWIRKVLNLGGEIRMNIVVSNLSKSSAIILEKRIIELFRKIAPNKITNTADGGLGFNHKGVPHSESHKKALEKAQPHKVRIPKEILYDLYVNKKLSKKTIGKMYGCGSTTIDRRLVEYNIPARKTKNYKVSYKLDRNEVLDMYITKRMSILRISKKLGIGCNGIRSLLKREGLSTGTNKFHNKCNLKDIQSRYFDLLNMGMKKMKIY